MIREPPGSSRAGPTPPRPTSRPWSTPGAPPDGPGVPVRAGLPRGHGGNRRPRREREDARRRAHADRGVAGEPEHPPGLDRIVTWVTRRTRDTGDLLTVGTAEELGCD